MGLDAYLYFQCPFRPDGTIDGIGEILQLTKMLHVMNHHGVPEIGYQVHGPNGVEQRTVTRDQATQGAARYEELRATCGRCPIALPNRAPGCGARIDYPVDDVALGVVRDAMKLNADSLEAPGDYFVRSLIAAGNCDGSRMQNVLASLGEQPSPAGVAPVTFTLDGRGYAITPYMVLEHLFFRPFLDRTDTLAVREWFRFFYSAIGNRMLEGPGSQDENAQALFGSSPSLQDFAALGGLVKQAEANRLSMMMRG